MKNFKAMSVIGNWHRIIQFAICILFMYILGIGPAWSQTENQWFISGYNIKLGDDRSGLFPNSLINSKHVGSFWREATQEGLSQFGGQLFTAFAHVTSTLPTNVFNTIATAKSGNIRATSRNEESEVHQSKSDLAFYMQPFFYHILWCKVLLVLVLFLAGYLIKKCRAQCQLEAKLKALIEVRTKDLEESHERFQLVNKATSDIIWDYDLVRKEVYWGDNFRNLLGHSPADKKQNLYLWLDNIHPEDAERVTSTFNAALKGESNHWEEEYRFQKADLRYASVKDRAYIIRDHTGKAIRMIGSMQEVTKLKEEEQRLKLLESVVTHATDAVLITDANLKGLGPRVMYANAAFYNMTGYAEEEVVGRPPRFLQGEKSDLLELKKVKQALQKGESCEVEVVNYRKNGEPFFCNMNISPVMDVKGVITHFISIERDVTERRKYLKAIEDQNARLREITWIQSHVVRAPLARILGLVDLLQDNHYDKDELKTLICYLKLSGLELDMVIKDVVNKAENVKKDIALEA